MEEVVTYLLILISWHPDQPGKFDVKRFNQIFLSQEECQLYGEDNVQKHEIYKEFQYGVKRTYHCVKGPSQGEFEDALEAQRAQRESGK